MRLETILESKFNTMRAKTSSYTLDFKHDKGEVKMETVKDALNNTKIVEKLKSEIMHDEYDLIIDEDWTVSNSFEAQMYLSFDEKQKQVYALSLANDFSENMLNLSMIDFFNEFGGRYDYVYSR